MPKKTEIVDEEEVTCPVCGKPVGLDVPSCPYCGAEFEGAEEEVDAESKPVEKMAAAVDGEETAECPVCGKSVSLAVSTCPNCGAEFEEEEVEEVIEVEEREVPAEAVEEEEKEPVHEEEEVEVAKESFPSLSAGSIMDLRVIGVALVILGIIGIQIALMIDWYWSWVPPIKSNLGLFVLIAAVVIIVGLAVFMLVKKAVSGGKKVPHYMPNMLLSIFLFGILALIMIMLWNPINNALQESNLTMAGAFIAVLVVGVLAYFMGMRMTSKSTA